LPTLRGMTMDAPPHWYRCTGRFGCQHKPPALLARLLVSSLSWVTTCGASIWEAPTAIKSIMSYNMWCLHIIWEALGYNVFYSNTTCTLSTPNTTQSPNVLSRTNNRNKLNRLFRSIPIGSSSCTIVTTTYGTGWLSEQHKRWCHHPKCYRQLGMILDVPPWSWIVGTRKRIRW
jgi:hypothetical protein